MTTAIPQPTAPVKASPSTTATTETRLPPETKRVHVNFAMRTYETLQRIANRKNGNISDALRQAITLTDYIERAVDENAKILIERDGKVNELVIR